VTGQRFSFRMRLRKAFMFFVMSALFSAAGCLSSGGPGETSGGGLADLIPGHQEAALRKRVEADSFPTANQALHVAPPVGDPGNASPNRDGT